MWTITLIRKNIANVLLLKDCCNPTCTVVRLSLEDEDISLINAYFNYAEDHIRHLESILTRFRNEVFLVAADVNARSVLYYNDSTDDRGEELELFTLRQDIVLFNCPSELSTFENTRGQSTNINVTIGSRSLECKIRDWQIHEEVSLFDHRMITFSISMSQEQVCGQRSRATQRRANIRAVSYTHLDVYKRQV